MKIAINFFESSFSREIYSEKRMILSKWEESINRTIEHMNYGESIQLFIIGLICVKPTIEHLFKVRRPKYIEKKTLVFGNVHHQIEKTFECELRVDYELMLTSEEADIKTHLTTSIIETIKGLKMPKKVTDFDKDRFVADVESVFRAEHLIE